MRQRDRLGLVEPGPEGRGVFAEPRWAGRGLDAALGVAHRMPYLAGISGDGDERVEAERVRPGDRLTDVGDQPGRDPGGGESLLPYRGALGGARAFEFGG